MKIKVLILFVEFTVLFITGCGRVSKEKPIEISSTVIDSDGDVGKYCSLVLENDSNIPHISYFDATNTALKYARWNSNSSSWVIETVDNAGDVGMYTSITLDGFNNPMISYYDGTGGDLKFAKKKGGSWEVIKVDASTYNVGEFSSITTNSNGEPLISYYDATDGDLMLAEWSEHTGTWKKSLVDENGDVGKYSRIIYYGETLLLVYYDDTRANPRWLMKTGNIWRGGTIGEKRRGEVISFDPTPGNHIGTLSTPFTGIKSDILIKKDGIELEPDDFAILNNITIQIKDYAYTASALYTVDYIISPDLDGKWISLSIDSTGIPYVAFYNETKAVPILAVYNFENDEWKLEEIPHDGKSGTDLSISIDKLGRPRIVYFNNDFNALIYSVWTGAHWEREMITSHGVKGLWPSIQLDKDDNPMVCYYDFNNGDLNFAYWVNRY